MLKIIFLLIAAAIPVMTLTLIVLAITSLFRIPFKYILGNLKSRRVSTFMSILGIGVVIAVMLSMQALDRGVTLATQSTASKNVLIVMREGSEAEISSWVTRDAEQIIRTLPGVAKVSPELTLIFKLPRETGSSQPARLNSSNRSSRNPRSGRSSCRRGTSRGFRSNPCRPCCSIGPSCSSRTSPRTWIT